MSIRWANSEPEIFAVFLCFEVVAAETPIGDGVDDAVDELADAGFPFGRAHAAVEIFADDDIGGGLRPIGRHFNVALLEKHRAFVVPNGGGAPFPGNLLIGGSTRFEFCM